MMASRSEVWLESPSKVELDWLIRQGVTTSAMVRPRAMMTSFGIRAEDGQFEYADAGERWFAFEQEEDFIFWRPRLGSLATYCNRAFALGEEVIDCAGLYALGGALNIFAGPLDWLRSERDGIVVLHWTRAFDRLRHVPRVAVAEDLLPLYRRHMRPTHLPELLVITGNRRAA